MTAWLLKNVCIVNEGAAMPSEVLIRHGRFERIAPTITVPYRVRELDAKGAWLFPGIIDLHVHFRTPGLTHKGDLATESTAALAGGVTTVFDMPNTIPPTIDRETLRQKHRMAREMAATHTHFYIALTNDNADECLRAVDEGLAAGVKVFLGSTTGNLLLTNEKALRKILSEGVRTLVHAEAEPVIQRNIRRYQDEYGPTPPFHIHPQVRPAAACLQSTRDIVELGRSYHAPLHLLHLSTADEVEYLRAIRTRYPQLTIETCPQYLWFSAEDFDRLQWRIKCNPAIKEARHRTTLRQAVAEGHIDTIGSDHAPHTVEEKQCPYWQSPSGMPMVQHTFSVMMTLARQGTLSLEQLPALLSHRPARIAGCSERGFIREGYRADCFLAHDNAFRVSPNNILYKCGWSPLEGATLYGTITHTWVDGILQPIRTHTPETISSI